MFKKIEPKDFVVSPFEKIGEEQMLITAVKPDGTYNTMTASWGGLGVLWFANVCFCFVRSSRYTDEFVKAGEYVTLSFFGGDKKDVLKFCGTHSGRDCDKVKVCKITPIKHPSSAVYFGEATDVIVAKKMYSDRFKRECFDIPELKERFTDEDIHNLYVFEIVEILRQI